MDVCVCGRECGRVMDRGRSAGDYTERGLKTPITSGSNIIREQMIHSRCLRVWMNRNSRFVFTCIFSLRLTFHSFFAVEEKGRHTDKRRSTQNNIKKIRNGNKNRKYD